MRQFMLKRSVPVMSRVKWLDRKTVYDGKLMSMTARVVRLFAPDPTDAYPHVDLSYDLVVPMR